LKIEELDRKFCWAVLKAQTFGGREKESRVGLRGKRKSRQKTPRGARFWKTKGRYYSKLDLAIWETDSSLLVDESRRW